MRPIWISKPIICLCVNKPYKPIYLPIIILHDIARVHLISKEICIFHRLWSVCMTVRHIQWLLNSKNYWKLLTFVERKEFIIERTTYTVHHWNEWSFVVHYSLACKIYYRCLLFLLIHIVANWFSTSTVWIFPFTYLWYCATFYLCS